MANPKPQWLVPFKGRNHSGPTNQNFLWKQGNAYVMDNHRAALWCWLNEMNLNEPHSMIHIDRHYDALGSRIEEWLRHLPAWKGSISDYLEKSCKSEVFGGQNIPVIRWDNYLSIYLKEFGAHLENLHLLTHDDGDKPDWEGAFHEEIWHLPSNFSYWLNQGEVPWVVNIDLDYFFYESSREPRIMVSDGFLDELFEAISESFEKGRIGVLTVCLTPDPPFTSGWGETEKLAARLLKKLGLEFCLPACKP